MKKTLLLIVMLCVLAGAVSAASPVMNNSRISPLVAYTDDTLLGYCNASDVDGGNLTYYYQWWNSSSLYDSGFSVLGTCYQETATSATSCGGLNTGGYGIENSVFNNNEYFYVNYSKPAISTSATWRVKLADYTTDVVVNDTCWDYDSDKLIFKIYSRTKYSEGEASAAYCYNGTWILMINETGTRAGQGNWNTGGTGLEGKMHDGDWDTYAVFYDWTTNRGWGNSNPVDYFEARIWEEAITWTMNQSGVELNVDNLSSSITLKSDTWILGCLANDGVTNSSWLNSSALVVSNSVPTVPSTPSFTSPAIAYTDSLLTLSAGVGSSDADSDVITYYYLFNDTGDASTLQGWSTTRTFDCNVAGCNVDDVIRGYVMATTSDANSTVSVAGTISITNKPVIVSSRISPLVAYTDSTLLGYCNASDVEGGNLTYYYQWWNGSSLYDSGVDGGSNAESVEFNVNNLSSVFTLKGESWVFGCLANDGGANSSWLNSSALVVSNSVPVFTEINFSTSISHGSNIAVQINATDGDSDVLSFDVNESRFTINSSGFLNKTNSISTVGSYNLTVNVTGGDVNVSGWIFYTVTNAVPVVSLLNISPDNPVSRNNLSFSNSSSDADGDGLVFDWMWFNDTVEVTALRNVSLVEAGNTSVNESWLVSLRVFDGLVWSVWSNSSVVTILDDTVPSVVISGPLGTVTSRSPTLLYNVSDDLAVANCSFWVMLGASVHVSNTTLNCSGSSTTLGLSADGSFVVWVFANDSSGNSNTDSQVFTVNTGSGGSGSVGGGGGTTIVVGEDDKIDCNVSVVPSGLYFSGDGVKKLKIVNDGVVSYQPQIIIGGLLSSVLSVTNVVSVLPSQSTNVGVRYDSVEFVEGFGTITLVDDTCKDLSVTVEAGVLSESFNIIASLFEKGNTIWDVLSEPVFGEGQSLRGSTGLFSVGVLLIICVLLMSLVLYKALKGSVVEGELGKFGFLLLLVLVFGAFLAVFVVTLLRLM